MIQLILRKKVYFYMLFLPLIPTTVTSVEDYQPDKVLKVGVRAIKGTDATIKIWKPTTDILSQNIKGYHFQLVPVLGFHDMRTSAKNKTVDFILTNPLAYIELNKKSGLTRLLTLNKKQPNGVASTTFASVIFTRSDRKDILNLKDIKNKKIIAVHEEAFGGWRIALRELLHQDIDPYKESSEVLFTKENTHPAVINAVLSGEADVGVIRTGIIERLVSQGKIKPTSIKVLNSHKDNLPALHSTQHYPEWPFSVLPHVPNEISNKVFHTLLSIKENSVAAKAGGYIGWTAPLDYSEVYNLSNELSQRYITFKKVWDKYWLDILILLTFLFAIILYTLYLFSINKKLSRSEFELSKHRDHLEEIVDARTEELIIQRARADEANQAKSDFLSKMSHELRTPLNSIMGHAQLVEMYDPNNKDITKSVSEIMLGGNFLLSLINEILDLATIESGKIKLNLEPVLCSDILNFSLNIVTPLANDKNITINFESLDECCVIADKKRLQQVCINLLSNAIKYNKQNGTIAIKIGKNNENLCEFSVKDSGIGIKPEFHNRMFQPFARDTSNADITEGTGVGLVITKNLVEQMQGGIDFNSEYGNGTEFWVTLPLAEI